MPGSLAAKDTCGTGFQPVGNRFHTVMDFSPLRVHMIGIGGSGMTGAAAMLLELGSTVSGSDMVNFEGLGSLVGKGARVTIGHRAELLDADVDFVVASAAIPESNPELIEARGRGVRVVRYAELLGLLMASRCGVAVAGTHGKTTTSAMCVHLFREAGLDPSFVIGAPAEVLGGNSGVGRGEHLIVEACEFAHSFLQLQPHLAAILNVEPDHLDCFKDFEHVVEAFARFAGRVEADGLLLCNGEDRWAKEAAGHARGQVETFGFHEGADWLAVNVQSDRGRYSFDLQRHGVTILSTRLSIPGRYNVANALAAIALACNAGGDPRTIAEALPTFTGVARRLSWRGEGRGVIIVDDYAHHPTEVRVSIEAARHRYQPRRAWVVFQPHQHFRTRCFMDEFAASFGQADEIIIPDVFGARETDEPNRDSGRERGFSHQREPNCDRQGAPNPNRDRQEAAPTGDRTAADRRPDCAESKELVSRIHRNGGCVRYMPTLEAVAEHLAEHLTEGDLVLTMGAGDVWKVADELVERLCGDDAARRTDRTSDLVSAGGQSALPVSTT